MSMHSEPSNQEAVKKTVMLKTLSREAYERLGRVRAVKPDVAAQIEMYILQLYQGGHLKTAVTDEQLKKILEATSAKKRDFNIRRV